MGNSVTGKKARAARKTKKKLLIEIGVVAAVILAVIIIRYGSGGSGNTGAEAGDLKILRSEVSETVKFYPYKAGGTNMEVLAVKASDGTIRTAFNTCQICYSSGRGYYEQQGDELVCRNCGNRFHIDQIGKQRGGCNPVPISDENKTENDTYIEIPQAFLEESSCLFGNWKRR